MLSLNDKRWSELRDAYGPATEIPNLIEQLAIFPVDTGDVSQPYFSLWSALCHQGDVYNASYAALPHLVDLVEKKPDWANPSVLALVANIEICRINGKGPEIPQDLVDAYRNSLSKIPYLISTLGSRDWDEEFCRAATALLAVAKGHCDLAAAILELNPSQITSFKEWLLEN